MKKNLIWFRNDLRLYDHTALYHACKSDTDQVIALFIATPEEWSKHAVSEKKISFMYYNLIHLQKKLLKLNIILHYHQSTNFLNSIEYLMYFCFKYRISNLFYHYQYEIDERNRDCLMKQKLSQQGICIKGFHDNLLVSNQIIKNNKNETYKVFSFFRKKITHYLYQHNVSKCFSIPLKRKFIENSSFFNAVSIPKIDCNFNRKFFPIGESEAIKRLKNFYIHKINDYSLKKNFPSLNTTSMLSPYLSTGIISSRCCLEMFRKNKTDSSLKDILTSSWLKQILWREFYYHLLISFPKLSKNQALVEWEKKIHWNSNMKYFNAWKEGNTGFPIVDAGMRQLNKLGWMHNRLRMITSSFLVKNLFIDWRIGERYFMSHLIDGDLALNNGGWQWSASIGTDSVSYIRILNPLIQSKKFDEYGMFIKKFIPELRHVPNEFIHQPHEWSQKVNCKLNYPSQIINYNDSRKRTLSIFSKVRSYLKKV